MDPQQITPTVPPLVVEQKRPMFTERVKVLLLVFLLLLLVAVVTYAVQNYQEQPQSDLLPLAEDLITPTPTPEEWKAYRNEKYEIEFKYPDSLLNIIDPPFSSEEVQIVTLASDDLKIDDTASPLNGSVHEGIMVQLSEISSSTPNEKSFVTKRCDFITLQTCQYLTVSNSHAVLISEKDSADQTLFVEKDGLIFKLTINMRPSVGVKGYLDLFDQILSSFRFVEEEAQTFSTTNYSIELPDDCTTDRTYVQAVIKCQYDSYRFEFLPDRGGMDMSNDYNPRKSTVKLENVVWNKSFFDNDGGVPFANYDIDQNFLVEVRYYPYTLEAETKFESILSTLKFRE